MARNCHKSAYHAVYLRGLTITYLYPPYLEEYDIYDAIEPWQVNEALEREPDIKAVLIVSPTYEGRISDVRAIAEIVHEKGIPFIVDEAHGAHLGLCEGFPQNSCQLGADLVIHSVHKTLPALTQTALLHVNGDLIDRRLLGRFLRIYQSSSPSYLLMAGIDNAVGYIGLQGKELFRRFQTRCETMLAELTRCRHLKVLRDAREKQDIGKLLISVKQSAITGKQLYDILLEKYHLQLEMAYTSYALAMFTINDGEEAYGRMTEALLAIDNWLDGQSSAPMAKDMTEKLSGAERQNNDRFIEMQTMGLADAIPIAAAWDMPTELKGLTESIGTYIGEFINLYPPGIPLLVPGERMTPKLCERISQAYELGLEVQGIQVREGRNQNTPRLMIPVIQEGHETALTGAGRLEAYKSDRT